MYGGGREEREGLVRAGGRGGGGALAVVEEEEGGGAGALEVVEEEEGGGGGGGGGGAGLQGIIQCHEYTNNTVWVPESLQLHSVSACWASQCSVHSTSSVFNMPTYDVIFTDT